jgi:signal transduction histidine kinase/CheY-like chemotaxis protein
MTPEKIRALLIEDNPADARLVKELLRGARGARFEIEWADRLAGGLERLEPGGIDVVLLDLSLPDCRGLETIVRVHGRVPQVPIVVLTGLGDESVMLEAVRNGAQDYLEKGRLDAESLTRAMRYAIQRKRAEHEIRARALQSATVAALGEEALSNLPLEDFMRKVATLVAGNLGVPSCEIVEASPDQGAIVLRATTGAGTPAVHNADRRDLSAEPVAWSALADRAMREGGPVIVDDFATERRFEVSAALRARGVASGAFVPVLGSQRPVGALGVFGAALRKFDEQDLNFLQSAANVLGAAIERKSYEDELVKARDIALETSRLKSAFLANMSHEIRTPLSGVIGMTELLLDTVLDAEQTECAETIRASADSLITIVNDILEFSRISAEKVVLEHKPFEPAQVVKAVTTLLSVEARRKGLTLTLETAADVPAHLNGDPVRLRQVLNNLVGNAVKFTDRGSVTVRVLKLTESEDQIVLRFEICDTGIGIPAHLTGLLFQPFSQIEDSSSRRYGGTGLGLAISAKLVALMGGEIGLKSESGHGSTFHFTARFGKSAHSNRPAPVVAKPLETAGHPRAPVLVVEDDAVSRKVVTLQLRKLGYEPRVASNGREALVELARNSYALVLMDCSMPDMNGYEATAAIRRREEGGDHHTIIVALTGHALDGERNRCLAAGMDGFVTKPIKTDELAAVLESCLGSGAASPARAADA